MRFIKPYGETIVVANDNQNIRKILLNKEGSKAREIKDIPDFSKVNPKLILGALIGTLDKIIKKPNEGLPPEKIRFVRDEIGKSLLNITFDKGYLKEGKNDYLTKDSDWQRKLHPYGEGQYKKAEPKNYKKFEGRYYKKFIGELPIEKLLPVDFPNIAQKIINHVFHKNLSLEQKGDKLKGVLVHTCNTIKENILEIKIEKFLGFTQEDMKKYLNCAMMEKSFIRYIYDWFIQDKRNLEKYKSEIKKNPKTSKPTFQFTYEKIMPLLKENYEICFEGYKIKDLLEEKDPIFHAHEAVRNYYLGLLERKKTKKDNFYTDMEWTIPKDKNDLIAKVMKLSENKTKNKNVNNDIRLGKIIHYTNGALQKEQAIDKNLIENSKYWGSEGQKEIKSSEAFIKSWFNLISFGNHSLSSLVKKENDILGFSGSYELVQDDDAYGDDKGKILLATDYIAKLSNILGNEHQFKGLEKDFIAFSLYKLNAIRNKVFHFHKKEDVFEVLRKTLINVNDNFCHALKLFVENDLSKSQEVLWHSFEAVGIRKYMHSLEDIDNFWKFVTKKQTQNEIKINLPKFNKLLKRADGIKDKIMTPPKAGDDNQGEFACQYLLLKTLYDKPFKSWFETINMEQLKKYIEQTKERLKKASEDLNNFTNALADFPQVFNDLNEYIENLTRLETMRGSMQNGYASNQKEQKKKSNAVENFKMEVLVYAFKDFLKDNNFAYLLNGLSGDGKKELHYKVAPISDSFEQWQAELYLVLHLVPVGIACDLEHQMTKYFLLNKGKDSSIVADEIHAVFALYRQNNDIKYGSTTEQTHNETITNFYENADDYTLIFKKNIASNEIKANVQHRHTRELVRFGVGEYLKKITETNKIKHEDVLKWQGYDEKDIAKKHKDLAKIHSEWVSKKKEFSDAEAYEKLLGELSEYRRIDNLVKLVDFRKLHKLVMQVLSRLAGYAFMYERDLYFMVLAYCYKNDIVIEDFFENTPRNIKNFKNGQVLTALDDNKASKKVQDLYFGRFIIDKSLIKKDDKGKDVIDKSHKDQPKQIRNDFAHFNMLHDKQNKFNLATYINQARIMVSYDRKLKNAVAKSIKTIFEKEKIDLMLTANSDHTLSVTKIETQNAYHLGTKKGKDEIAEPLHSPAYLSMVEGIF